MTTTHPKAPSIRTGAVLHGVRSQRPKPRVPLGTRIARRAGSGAGGSGPTNGTYAYFIYNGGPVITNPVVYNVYLGDWTSAANQNRATRLDTFITDLMNSSFMNTLSQYGCGSTGTFKSSVFIANSKNSLLDTDLHTFIQQAIDANTLPEPTANSGIVFNLILDDATGVDDGVNILCDGTSDNAFGYHSAFTTTAGNTASYAVVPGLTDKCLTQSCPEGNSTCSLQTTMTQEQRQTKVLSHEFSEMITDPLVLTTPAWTDPRPFVGAGEAGDICNFTIGTITVGANTWTVQPIYSKWDDMQSDGATTCVYGEPGPLPSLLPSASLILDRSTFGKDEVDALITASGSAPFTDALYVVLDNFSPDELGLTPTNLTAPPNQPSFTGAFAALSGVTLNFDATTGVQVQDTTNLLALQRIVFPYTITFANDTAFNALSPNAPTATYDITATITLSPSANYPSLNVVRSASAEFELVLQADPYMSAGESWWLSNDIRVFTVTPAQSGNMPPLPGSTTLFTTDPNTYVQALIDELNTFYNVNPASTTHPFDRIAVGEDQSALLLSQNNPSGQAVYNFALTRVRLRGDVANDVRLFFRLFISSSPDTGYDVNTTFRRAVQTDALGNPIPGTLIPLQGFITSDMSATIPFFAAPRIDATSASTTTQSDPKNVQTIPDPAITNPPPPGTEIDAYFGCWLDINEPTPRFPLNPSTASTIDGPWKPAELLPIPDLIMGNHACLVAEIAYDPDPIPPAANAGTSDKIGQRNLAWGSAGSSGSQAARAVPNTFGLRPTPVKLAPGARPDELMIEWGNLPAGSVASIYWPGVSADEVLQLAAQLYTLPKLQRVDANTFACDAGGGVTFVPVPPSSAPSFAGLITLDLPPSIRSGRVFDVVVRRVTSRFADIAERDVILRNWRYVSGAFAIRVPVHEPSRLLADEENTLAVFKYKLDRLPKGNIWHPVLSRYVDRLAARVNAFGGNASAVPPSLAGSAKPKPLHPVTETCDHTGKIGGLVYDRFGDFERFLLCTVAGDELSFNAGEPEIEHIVKQAWLDRMLVTVVVRAQHPHDPKAIILRRPPRLEG